MMLKMLYNNIIMNARIGGWRSLLILLMLVCAATVADAQIKIKGSVYGGARQADVKGYALVEVGADKHDVLIGKVYGGNDISGSIGTAAAVNAAVPTELTGAEANGIDATYSAFVRICPTTPEKHIFIGNLFGGGNGDYDYENDYQGMTRPELSKAYLEIMGGTIAYVYGGGNNATVTEKTDIYIDNESDITTAIPTGADNEHNLLLDTETKENVGLAQLGNDIITQNAYHFSRVFGGNNKAEMKIQPTWHLSKGKIDNLYSGGNEGPMTSPVGLLLEIDPQDSTQAEKEKLVVNNVYGGCRKADVHPKTSDGGEVAPNEVQLTGYKFPAGLAARVLVKGGKINNVYGGNDISGKVYGGNAVGIYSSIEGNVYGGGNGSYPYTDNALLKDDPQYGDYYYEVPDGKSSVAALNEFRPNAEQVSLRLYGTENDPTTIGGAVYVGGNSATLASTKQKPMVELKIGSYVIAEDVFLGNNGENMVKSETADDVLQIMKSTDKTSNGTKFNSMNLEDSTIFKDYMQGCAMSLMPSVKFDSREGGDPADYIPYSTYIGSLICGGNRGSMNYNGKNEINFKHEIVIFNKVVGGCNNAYVAKTGYNAAFDGGILGDKETSTGNKLVLNFEGLKIMPMRWKKNRDGDYNVVEDANGNVYDLDVNGNRQLEFNTISAATGQEVAPVTTGGETTSSADDMDRRFDGGHIYGGCYTSGHVNGNVVININASIVDLEGEHAVFDRVQEDEDGEAKLNGHNQFTILQRRSGVIRGQQGMDVLGSALNVFGGGYGKDSEIWGSTTINLNKGYAFQIFGGGEMGAIGVRKKKDGGVPEVVDGKYVYEYDSLYSTTINLCGTVAGQPRSKDTDEQRQNMAATEFIYGGGFEGPIAGNTVINLGNGRVFDTFAGSCNADIQGHTETYIGRQVAKDGTITAGFPYVRDDVYGGNDLGGNILGSTSFKNRVSSEDVLRKVYKYSENTIPEVLTASAYIEFTQGRVDTIFGGCYGYYNYKDSHFRKYTYTTGKPRPGFTKPRMDNAFVNFRPVASNSEWNKVLKIYGAGQGYPGEIGKDSMQHRSYVLIDIPQTMTNFQTMEVFGAGAYSGLGMGVAPATLTGESGQPDKATAVIDLVRGQIAAAYGASFKQGVTRRTMVNVPEGSTIELTNIFGGAYGLVEKDGEGNDVPRIDVPCDAYEANVNYSSRDAIVHGALYGGNNSCRRTLYGKVNVNTPVYSNKESGYTATVYGAGLGVNTWSQYTEVNLNEGAEVYEVYGGGQFGRVFNKGSVAKWKDNTPSLYTILGEGYADNGLTNELAKLGSLGKTYNTNVRIMKGAKVVGYAYGGGLGADTLANSGNVYGTTNIELLGGIVSKDIYAAGTVGAVFNVYDVDKDDFNNDFIASANAYIEGGMVRNVYGGGWKGDVGYHDATTTGTATDVLGETNVVIGIREDQANKPADYGFYKGVPAIQRNAYSGGEGGAVFGTANLTLNNGYIGYVHLSANESQDEKGYVVASNEATVERYEEKINDETSWDTNTGQWQGKDRLKDCGNVFGGGYDVRSSVDSTNVTVWGGVIRNSLHGGAEIATIGRGKMAVEEGANRQLQAIYKAGGTRVTMYNGHVKRNVFGGGKGYNLYGYGQQGTLYTDGYVFGQTEVYIYGGEIGTAEGVAEGYGNVFGGGDIGYVYSKGYFSDRTKAKEATGSPNHIYYYDGNGHLTEDCKVVVSPYLQAKESVTINGHSYNQYDYVVTEDLNYIQRTKDSQGNWTDTWEKLDTGNKEANTERGVMIHNAVFAGGNVSSNSDQTYANAITVFGNSTATLNDVYHRDFITVGTEHIGGLYGGGNLSVVGGYRELNITNYGTDYYGLDSQITLAEYQKLSNRERAYFKLEYLCVVSYTKDGKTYTKDVTRISEDEYNQITDPDEKAKWQQYGFCSIYAGRLLNTVQRADLCGVFGSRLVLQGAKDRVADVGDNTVYTLNRVGELSLNKQTSVINADTGDDKEHGNYFGIYSVVNYLGHLTSDVKFDDLRTYVSGTDNGKDIITTGTENYHDWKEDRLTKKDRNIGTSHNQLALASGVFLELTTEMSTKTKKVYGDITGIVELDLINVKKDVNMGGGYVYARNEHGSRTANESMENVILSSYNMAQSGHVKARTYKIYTYSTEIGNLGEMETSGNFIHRRKRIIDDCYPNNGVYKDGYQQSPAHYWFIKGDVYVYDQTVSAYAGAASAYSKEVKIPLTITAGSNGKLQLLNVQPNLYAYYATADSQSENNKITEEGVKVDNESTIFYLNDVITWWDWQLLPQNEQKYFVKETYVNVDTCKVNGVLYPAGTYVLENDPTLHNGNASQTAYAQFKSTNPAITSQSGSELEFDAVFHPSNNISHDTGYVLTFDMDTPTDWDDWYSPKKDQSILSTRKKKAEYEALGNDAKENYREGPTFRLKSGVSSGLYGQQEYAVGDIIAKEVVDDYTTTTTASGQTFSGQASVEEAYVAKSQVVLPTKTVLPGYPISKSEYNSLAVEQKSAFAAAMVCTSTIQLGEEEFVLKGDLVDASDENLTNLATRYKNFNNSRENADQLDDAGAKRYVESCLSNAYYCTTAGKYGGQYFKEGENYSAIKAWCSLSDERDNFEFNYDAFDVLADPAYSANPARYDYDAVHDPLYSAIKPVEYQAANTGTESLTYKYEGSNDEHTLAVGESISREKFEMVQNDQRHYTRVLIAAGGQTVYIANDNFFDKGIPYAKGQSLSEEEYDNLSDKSKVTVKAVPNGTSPETMYYCYEAYGSVREGDVISASAFAALPNYQRLFTIQGIEPTETTTLYVSRESVFKDVTKEKVISVVYQYTYYEDDDEGNGVSLTNELHVVNIHLQLESGVPQIGQLTPPATVLPGNSVGLKKPEVIPGLYEVLINGWEIYTNEEDALNHRNGEPFSNGITPVYWYQNNKAWVAFYSKTYLGKTYSNPVPITVANYHDIADVMADKEHHMYVDYDPAKLDRHCKIYINDATEGLNQLKSFIDLSCGTNPDAEHSSLNAYVEGGDNLDFILHTDIRQTGSWTSIANTEGHCFEGTFHGDGHTISGLDHSLFGHLCGDVYNLGVTGSFTSAGIADTGSGYVENCWVKSSTTVNGNVKAVFGNPNREDTNKPIQVVNCYYPETNAYKDEANSTKGVARKMKERDFYNGTVAYNLNGFYLNKRYYDSQTGNTSEYKYLKDDPEHSGTLLEAAQSGYYPASPDLKYGDLGYVERRYEDGDFIYADGVIPESTNIRMRTETTGTGDSQKTEVKYYPIWPDDYLFFGQTLTFGYSALRAHQDQPSTLVKSGDRLPTDDSSNRVYRAPAYYGDSRMSTAHFNPMAHIVAYSAPKHDLDEDLTAAYPGMTAIDFKGHNDATATLGWNNDLFYQPLLDDDGLTGIVNKGETPNLLVYAPAATDNQKTYNVLTKKFTEPAFSDHYQDPDTYKRVTIANASEILGHLVQSDLTTDRDHLLVDKQDFNCPIAYRMGNEKRMWYQRKPEAYKYVTMTSGKTKGWDDICLPFDVELVSTQTKGEITHFYQGSTKGHEYWLREFTGVKSATDDELVANFTYPNAGTERKDYTNTYLWDYYYSKNSRKDINTDEYQTYYSTGRTIPSYPRAQAGTPYLIGFPGETYYEFDLSGRFDADYTAQPAPAQIMAQTITFASGEGAAVGVSDKELGVITDAENKQVTKDGYIFWPTYSHQKVDASFLLNTDGDKYEKQAVEVTMVPFRPFFKQTAGTRGVDGAKEDDPTRRILINEEYSELKGTVSGIEDLTADDLIVNAKRKKITVESQLHYVTDVSIVTPAGITLKTFTIQPSEYVETRVANSGVYIVYADNGKYVKKVIVR